MRRSAAQEGPQQATAAEGAGCAMDAIVLQDQSGRLCSSEFFVQFKPLRIHRTTVYLRKALGVKSPTSAASPSPGSPVARPRSPEEELPELYAAWITVSVNGEQVNNINMVLGTDYRVSFLCPDTGVYVQEMTDTLLRQFNLQAGRNRVVYKCELLELKTTIAAECDVFLWAPSQQLIVFDVDGTITKSDVVGYVETVYFGTFTHYHPGVCTFLSQMQARGYEVVYLTSRPIEAVGPTKTLLNTLREGADQLPKGPLFMNTLSPMKALYQEVWMKASGAFKAAVLQNVCQLFVSAGAGTTSPFVAGFGNRLTDVHAYKAANVPDGMIFTIDTNSIVRVYQPNSADVSPTQQQPLTPVQDMLFVSTACQVNVVEEMQPLSPSFDSYEDSRLVTWVTEMIDDPTRREYFAANLPLSERMARSPIERGRTFSSITRITRTVLTRSHSQPMSAAPSLDAAQVEMLPARAVDTTATSGAV